MIIIQETGRNSGELTAVAYGQAARHFEVIAKKHGVSLEQAVGALLVPLVCAAIRAPRALTSETEAKIEDKIRAFEDRKVILPVVTERGMMLPLSLTNTSVTWGITKRLKAELSILAETEGRTLSNWLTYNLAPYSKVLIEGGVVVMDHEEITKRLSAAPR
jgi:hypothetical protein